MRINGTLAWAVFLLSGATSVAADTALDRLDAMSRGMHELTYRGEFTFEHGQTTHALRIAHELKKGMERERIVHLDGSEREFVRNGHPANCVHTGDRLARFDRLALPHPGAVDELSSAVPAISRSYVIEEDGVERVANRNGLRLRISPRDHYRYGMVLVLDESSSMLLKSETLDGAGRVLERFQFVNIEIGTSLTDSDFNPETKVARAAAHQISDKPKAEAGNSLPAWTVSWLPDGFALSSRDLEGQAKSAPVEYAMYTDGLATLSVFVETSTAAKVESGYASQGATVAVSVPRGGNGIVTVVGEIPAATAQLIANSVNFTSNLP